MGVKVTENHISEEAAAIEKSQNHVDSECLDLSTDAESNEAQQIAANGDTGCGSPQIDIMARCQMDVYLIATHHVEGDPGKDKKENSRESPTHLWQFFMVRPSHVGRNGIHGIVVPS